MSVLHPHERVSLLELLRPPQGYRLDEAVGTTYSLDLLAMLVLPIGFTWMELEGPGSDAPTSEPLKILVALRQLRDRLTIFCQAGQIKLPSRHHRLVALLEDSLVEATSPSERGSFHPKTWALRFVGEQRDDVWYRFITLSRNITFDRSWDTTVTVEGPCRLDRTRGFGETRPLKDFYTGLAECAVKPLAGNHRTRLERFASELHRVEFQPAAPFEEIAFHSIGLGAEPWEPLDREIDRILVMSPFVDLGFIKELRQSLGTPRALEYLVSRPESLDELGSAALTKLNVAVLETVPDASPELQDDAQAEIPPPQSQEVDDSGLHAKLYIVEKGAWASVLTGSANATARAFERNVEFLIELTGKKGKVGIDAILGNDDGGISLGRLLQGYQPQPVPESTSATRAAERKLDEWCQQVASLEWHIDVSSPESDRFLLGVHATGSIPTTEPAGITTRVVPIGAQRTESVPLPRAIRGASFYVPGLAEVSALLLVHAQIVTADATVERAFTTVAALNGAPTDRLDQLVTSEISRSGGLVEWLYLLLGQDPPVITDGGGPATFSVTGEPRRTARRVQAAGLFETLVREAAEGGTRLIEAQRALDGLNSLDSADPMVPRVRNLLEQLVRGLDDQT